MLENPLALAGLYFLAAVFFAIFYFVMWGYDPDTFIIHEEINLRPLRMWRTLSALSGLAPAERPLTVDSLEAIYPTFSNLFNEEFQVRHTLETLEAEIKDARSTEDNLRKRHDKEMATKMESLLQQHQSAFNQALHEANTELARKLAGDLTKLDLTQVNKEWDERVAKADSTTTEAMKSIIRDSTSTSVLSELSTATDKLDQLLAQQIELSTKLRTVKDKQRDLLEPYEEARRNRLGFFDFLYFSVGVATSNTFGDIIPNTRVVRGIILVQVALSIVLVAFIVNELTRM